jgi:antitoxin (DNA-binding transcriptional repressor) of toxin-antitoxin stability system
LPEEAAMVTVSLAELRQNPQSIIDLAIDGEPVDIVDGDHVVAHVVPAAPSRHGHAGDDLTQYGLETDADEDLAMRRLLDLLGNPPERDTGEQARIQRLFDELQEATVNVQLPEGTTLKDLIAEGRM